MILQHEKPPDFFLDKTKKRTLARSAFDEKVEPKP
jgi:hypothetical protein